MQYFSFQWHITDWCDQRCRHCYIFSEGHPELLSVSVEQAKKVIDSCVEMCDKMGGRRPYFYVTGGDPLLHPQVWEILGMLKAKEIPFTILGNPFHLTDENCQKLKFYGCEKYQLSIDGSRETHDFMRKPGSFDTTLEKIEVLHRNGIRVAIMTTVSGVNADQMPEIIDTVVAHEADVFAFARYCPTSLEKSAHLTPQQYRQVLDTCWKKYLEYGENCKTTFNLKDHLWGLYLHEIGQFKIPDGLYEDTVYDGCNCGHGHFTILPNGDVMACRRFESKVGNVFDTPLYDLWTSPQMDYYRQYEKFEKCHDCELLRFCRGCPAVAFGHTHNFFAADPQCWKAVQTDNRPAK